MKQKFDIDWVSQEFYSVFHPAFKKEFEREYGCKVRPSCVTIEFDVVENKEYSVEERKELRKKAIAREKELLGIGLK